MTKDRRLGRGLAALLGTPMDDGFGPLAADLASGAAASQAGAAADRPRLKVHPAAIDDEPVADDPNDVLLHLNVYEIDDNPFQPRRTFREEEIASLAESLKAHEMLQPVLVRRVGDRYQLISGERRLRAAIHAGWTTVPARLREADDRLVAELAIVENLQRKDLNAVEKALSFKRYLDQHQCTQEDLARRLKIDRSSIANMIRLLELPAEILEAISAETLSAGHARSLLPLGDERLQIEFCRKIQQDGWSVRDTERLVAERIAQEDGAPQSRSSMKRRLKSEHVAALERQLRMAIGTKVEIRANAQGKGRVIVHFSGHDEFERLVEYLSGRPSEG